MKILKKPLYCLIIFLCTLGFLGLMFVLLILQFILRAGMLLHLTPYAFRDMYNHILQNGIGKFFISKRGEHFSDETKEGIDYMLGLESIDNRFRESIDKIKEKL